MPYRLNMSGMNEELEGILTPDFKCKFIEITLLRV